MMWHSRFWSIFQFLQNAPNCSIADPPCQGCESVARRTAQLALQTLPDALKSDHRFIQILHVQLFIFDAYLYFLTLEHLSFGESAWFWPCHRSGRASQIHQLETGHAHRLWRFPGLLFVTRDTTILSHVQSIWRAHSFCFKCVCHWRSYGDFSRHLKTRSIMICSTFWA